jgi:hypothetical protein
LRVTVGEGKAETPLEMNPPEPWEPREKKKAKMRGEKDDE